jgi:alpha/beta superfamily hydrolase
MIVMASSLAHIFYPLQFNAEMDFWRVIVSTALFCARISKKIYDNCSALTRYYDRHQTLMALLKSIRMQGTRGWFVLLLLMCFAGSAWAMGSKQEKAVCGIKEPFVFWRWSSMAGEPDSSRVSGFSNVESISIATTDGRTLQGYRLNAMLSGRALTANGYLLVAQGNAMLADQVLGSFIEFSQSGFDVYIFDYRGYGRSQGKRRLKAIVNDYREIIDHLDSQLYPTRLLYGMSFGGIVLLDALDGRVEDRRVVIDSTPSRLSDYGCPRVYDPVENLPKDSSNLYFVTGLKDAVVKPAMSRELVELAKKRGAFVMVDPEMAHPFMDRNVLIHNRRINTVKSFLLR